jgi:general secretion pathway protein C
MGGIGRRVLDVAVPIAIAATALFNARTIAALTGGNLWSGMMLAPASQLAPEARTRNAERRSANAILTRNPFDHVTGSLVHGDEDLTNNDARLVPCGDVRAQVLVSADEPERGFVVLEHDGKRSLRSVGGRIDEREVVIIGRSHVLLRDAHGALCVAGFGAPSATQPAIAIAPAESLLAGKVERVSETSYRVERTALDRLLDAQTELMKSRLVPERRGDRTLGMRIYGIKPGSALALLGLENGDRIDTIAGIDLSNPANMLDLYARLKTGVIDRLAIKLERGGRSLDLDYVVR